MCYLDNNNIAIKKCVNIHNDYIIQLNNHINNNHEYEYINEPDSLGHTLLVTLALVIFYYVIYKILKYVELM